MLGGVLSKFLSNLEKLQQAGGCGNRRAGAHFNATKTHKNTVILRKWKP